MSIRAVYVEVVQISVSELNDIVAAYLDNARIMIKTSSV